MSEKIKIFIVEDDEQISEMYSLKLNKEWFDVKIATDWFKALAMLWEYVPDLILLDIMMPWMDGFETIRTIRKLAPSLEDTKIIMFSNLNSKEDIDKAYEYWADDYLLKASTTPKDVVSKIVSHLSIDKDWFLDRKNETPKTIICPHCSHTINL